MPEGIGYGSKMSARESAGVKAPGKVKVDPAGTKGYASKYAGRPNFGKGSKNTADNVARG